MLDTTTSTTSTNLVQNQNVGDLIDLVLKVERRNQSSIFVFIYNVLNGVPVQCIDPNNNADDDDDTLVTIDTLNSRHNAAAFMNGGYLCDDKLWSLCQCFQGVQIDPCDFGITILMLYFAQYYAREQYPLFADEFQCVKELAVIERFLLSYNQNRIMLPLNLSIHPKYGLKKQASRFVNKNHVTMVLFKTMISLMQQQPGCPQVHCTSLNNLDGTRPAPKRAKVQKSMADTAPVSGLTPEMFVEFVAMFHVRIVESFYMFTSISKNCKVLVECAEFKNVRKLEYTFTKPIRTDDFTMAQYWFQIPSGALWFGYYNGNIKFSSYASADTYHLLNVFKTHNVQCVVVGFVDTTNNKIAPLIFEDMYTDWRQTVDAINFLKLPCVFRPMDELTALATNRKTLPRFYFVRAGIPGIFKYEKKL